MYPISDRTSKSSLISISLLILICFWIYSPVKSFDYLAIDDSMHTEANPKISPLTFENVGSFWKEPYENAYTPITYTLWAFLAHLGKNSDQEKDLTKSRMNPEGNKFKPGVFHLANLWVHCLSVTTLFILLHFLFPSIPAAFFGAALFAMHPLQVETVCWITGLRDVLAGLFSLLSIYTYLRYASSHSDHSKKWILYCVSFLCFFIGVLCKSSSLMAPLIGGMLAFFYRQRKIHLVLLDFIPWVLLITPVMRVFFGLNDSVALRVVYKAPLPQRFLIAGDAVSFYLTKLFFPFELTMDYGRTPQFVLGLREHYLTGLFPVFLGILSIFLYIQKKTHLLLLSFGIFVIGPGPVLGVTPFIFQHISTTADRYVYLSMLGPAIAFAILFRSLPALQIRIAMGLFLVLLGMKSASQTTIWKNNLTLFAQTLEHTPSSWLASNDLGTVFEGMGQFDTAMSLYERSGEIANIPSAWNNAGAMAVELKDFERAKDFFDLAIRSSNGSSWAHHNMGAALLLNGERKKALEQYGIATSRDERFKEAHKNPIILRKDDGRKPTS